MSGDNHNQADPLDLDAIEARAEIPGAVVYGGMVHYLAGRKDHHPDVTCPCSPTPIWMPRP